MILEHLIFLAPFISFIFSGIWDISIQVYFNWAILILSFLIFIESFFPHRKLSLPSDYNFLFITIFLMGISYTVSPVRGLITFEFSNFIISILFLFIGLNIKQEISSGVLKISYILIFIATIIFLYNIFSTRALLPQTAMTNPNNLAFTCLLTMGIAFEKKNFILGFYLLIVLLLTKSIGGISSFFIIFVYYLLKKGWNKKIILLSLFFVLIFFVIIFNPSSLPDRLRWWKEAFLMFIDRPLFGWGQGSYLFIHPAYHEPSNTISSVYAHNYYLEFLCENGIFAFIFWFYFLFCLIYKSYGFYRYSLIAVMLHSFMDFGLGSINNFWLFLLIAGISQREKVEFKNLKFYFAIFLIYSGFMVKWFYFADINLKIENAIKYSNNYLAKQETDKAYDILLKAAQKNSFNFDLNLRLADIMLEKALQEKDKKLLFKAACQLEYVLILNPYYFPAYIKLEKIYNEAKEKEILKELSERQKRYIKWKK